MKIKALMLPKWYPSNLDPAEGNYVERHIRAISKIANVVVLYVHSVAATTDSDQYLTFNIENDISVIRVFFKRAKTGILIVDKMINVYRYVKAQSIGYNLVKEKFGEPSLIHAHVLTRTCFLAVYLKWTRGIPFMISEHWSGFLIERNAFKGFFKPMISRYLAAKAFCISCVSEVQRAGMKHYGYKNRIEVIPNVIDTELFRPSILNGDVRKKRIIHISRLDSDPKNIPGILRSIKQLSAVRDDFELHLVGDGIEAEKQKQLCQDMGLNEVVFFHGHISQDRLANIFGSYCFLLMFSNYESQSCVILEAFSCGIPVIATRVGGIPEIVDISRGVLVEKGGEEALTLEISKMLDSHKNYNPEKARMFVINNFAIPVIANRFLNIYSEMISSK